MVIAVGGGDQAKGETQAIDTFALGATGVSAPRVVFLPTGTKDSPDYALTVEKVFLGLGARKVTTLALTRNPSRRHVAETIAGADLIYLGGGSAGLFAKHGARYGLRELLVEALGRDAVLEGLSGGAIALFDGGYGAYNGYKPLPGWGLGPGFVLPHFTLGEELGAGEALSAPVVWGVEDGAALVWHRGRFGVVRHRPSAGAWELKGPGVPPVWVADWFSRESS